MEAVDFVLCSMIDNDGIAAFADFMSDRRLDLKLAARLQPECDLVLDATHNPAVFGTRGVAGVAVRPEIPVHRLSAGACINVAPTVQNVMIGLVGFTVASMMCGAAQSLTQMVVFRLLQGVFGAALVTAGPGRCRTSAAALPP